MNRLAGRATIQLETPYGKETLTPMGLFNFAIKDVPGIELSLTTNQEYDLKFERLKVRHRKLKTIPGTQKNHQFIPVSDISI